MKLIIAGSRTLFPTVKQIADEVSKHRIPITEIVSGKAPGVDTCGEYYAKAAGQPVTPFPAAWTDLTHPDAVIRIRKDGTKYDALAGHRRNKQMAEYADAILLIWNGESKGSANMKATMLKLNKPIYEVIIRGTATKG